MANQEQSKEDLECLVQELRERLEVAEGTLQAIMQGEVDALVVSGVQGERIFTLQSADYPYRLFVEEMKEGAATVNPRGMVLYCNNRLASLLKYPLEKIISSDFIHYIRPSNKPTFQALLQQTQTGTGKCELYLITSDKTEIPVHISISQLVMDDVIINCLIITDLTEQKRNEEIMSAELLARSILDQAAEAIIVCDQDGQIIRASQAAYELSGENPIFQPFNALFPLQLEPTQWQNNSVRGEQNEPFSLEAVLAGNSVQGVEVYFQRNDGQDFNLLLSARSLSNPDSQMTGCVVTLTDITRRKQAEVAIQQLNESLENRVKERTAQLIQANTQLQDELLERQRVEQALQESKQQLELALEGSGDGFWDWDIASGQVYYNPRYVQMLGYELDEFPREVDGWGKLIHPDDYQRVMEILDAHFKDSSVPYSFDYRLLTKSGEWKWIADYGKIVVRDRDGKPLRMTGTHKDITERKLTENLIKASLREKEVLLKEIHHRVKNNLQIVSSLLQLQSRRTQEKQVAEILKDSQNRIASIALVHEKLYRSEDLANIDFGQYLPDLITHLFDTYKIKTDAVTLSTNVDPILLEIDTAIPCGLIVNELVSNSIKYAFPNNRQGEIQIEFYTNSDDKLTLIIRDDGIGIPNEFDIETTSSLGLTLVQGLVDQLEGRLELDRSKGTEFKIIFPRS